VAKHSVRIAARMAIICHRIIVALLLLPSTGIAQIRLDSLVDSEHHWSGVAAVLSADSVTSRLGVVAPSLELMCLNNQLRVALKAAFAPGAMFRTGWGQGNQDVEIQADTTRAVRINMRIVPSTNFPVRWLQTTDGAQKWLEQIAIARVLTVKWKLYDFEEVTAVFHLDTLASVRQGKLARPWQACGKKLPW